MIGAVAGVLSGLSLIWVIIVLGWALGRFRVLPSQAPEVLNRLVFFVASPALLFATLAGLDVRTVFGPPLIIAGASAIGSALLFVLYARIRRLDLGRTVVGAMSSSLNNAGHLGIPLATYILGSPQHVLPVLVFQLGFFSPMYFVLSDLAGRSGKVSPGKVLRMIVTNPMLIAAVLGISVSLTGLALPDVVFAPIETVAGLAVPAILIAFGLSLDAEKVLPARAEAPTVAVATVLKLAIHPLLAWVLARYAFGLSAPAVFAAVAMAGLPTAQNAYVAAFRARTGEGLARSVVLSTTILVTPSLLVIAALLA